MPRPRTFDTDTAVEQCVEPFWDGSYATTSTDDLCQSTGLSRSSLYNAFGSKRGLYLRVLRSYDEQRAAEREELLARDPDATGAQALLTFMRAVLDTQWADEDRRACLGINACVGVDPQDEEIRGELERNAVSFGGVIGQLIARGQRDGSLDDHRPAADLAWLVHATLDGLQVRSRVHPDRAAIDRCLQTLLDQLRPRA